MNQIAIIQSCAKEFDIPPALITNGCQIRDVVDARDAAVWIMLLGGMKTKPCHEILKVHRTSLIRRVRKVQTLMQTDKTFEAKIKKLEKLVYPP